MLAFLHKSLRILAVVAIVLGLGWYAGAAHVRAGAAELIGVDGTTYESPTWGFTLDWDQDDWEAVRATSELRADALFLNGDEGALFVQGIPYRGDVEECRAALVGVLRDEEGVADWRPLEDEAGDEIAGEEPDRAFAAFGLTFSDRTGASEERANYVECRTLIAGEAALTVLLIAALDDYADAMAAAAPVLDSIALAAAAGDDEDEDEDEDDDDEERPGRDEGRFVSEKYGFSLTWAAPWEVRLQIVSGDPAAIDQLVLTNGTSTVVLSGVTGYDGDAAECLVAMEEVIRDDRDNDAVELGEDEDGDPILDEDEDRAYALFVFDRDRGGIVPVPPDAGSTFTGPSGETAHYVECRTLVPGETVLVIGHDTPLDDYADEVEARDELLDGLEIEPAADGDVTAEEPPGAATSCEGWFVATMERSTRALELNPPRGLSPTIPEAMEFAEGYRALSEEQADSTPPPEAEELNELVVAYFGVWSEYWRLTSEQLQDPGNIGLLLEATDALTLALTLHADLLIDSQLVAAACGLDEREYVLP